MTQTKERDTTAPAVFEDSAVDSSPIDSSSVDSSPAESGPVDAQVTEPVVADPGDSKAGPVSPYPHLLPEVAALLDSDDQTRIAHAAKAEFIEHARAGQILDVLDRMIRQPVQDRMDGVLIAGPTFSGKTWLARYFQSLYPRDVNVGGDSVDQKVAYALAPDRPDLTRLISQILRAVGGVHLSNEKPETVRERMLQSARRCGLKVLILDEIHGVLNGQPKQQRLMMTAIKNLSNEMNINIVLLGTKEAFIATSAAEEMETRFPVEWLPAWQDDENFKGLLQAFESQLPLRNPSNLMDLSDRLYRMCGGSLGWLSRLLSRAAEEAITSGAECISPEVLDRVVESGWKSPSDRNTLRQQIESGREPKDGKDPKAGKDQEEGEKGAAEGEETT